MASMRYFCNLASLQRHVLWVGLRAAGLCALALFCSAVVPCAAEVILSNGLDPPYRGDGTIFNDKVTLKGVGVEIRPGTNFVFESFRVVLDYMSGTPDATGHIYENDGTWTPGPEIQVLNTDQVSGGTEIYDFTSPVSVTLEAGKKYWLVVSDGPGTGWYRWDRTDPPLTPTGAGIFLIYSASFNGGSSWSYSDIYCAFELNGTPQPVLQPPDAGSVLVVR